MTYSIFIPGRPVPKGRPRFGNGRTYTPVKTQKEEQRIALAYKGPCYTGAVSITLNFWFSRPKTNRKEFMTQRPDCDNLAKLVTDALNGKAYVDDQQIVELKVSKNWAVAQIHSDIKLREGVHLTIEEIV